MHTAGYQLVQLANGTHTVYASDYAEKMHPGLGPAAEAELLYVRQLKIAERMGGLRHYGEKIGNILDRIPSPQPSPRLGEAREAELSVAAAEEFVIWDVGLGAAANAIAVLRATQEISRPLRLISFDDTSGPLGFARENAGQLGYLQGYEGAVDELLRQRGVTFQNGKSSVAWEFHLGDFPALLERMAHVGEWDRLKPELQRGDKLKLGFQQGAPHAILFDAFSPAKNPAMWTLPLFTNLFRQLDPARPCNLTTYSRSTLFRVTLLLAGFFVGRGVATGLKEETTVAANALALLDEPLDARWLERARRSDSAEPLHEAVYRRAALTGESWEKLQAHPQFKGA